MKNIILCLILFSLIGCKSNNEEGADKKPPFTFERSYEFNGSIPENVLHSYLSRAITQAELCCMDSDKDFEENLRMLKNVGAKFIGRAAFVWTPTMDEEKHFELVERYAQRALAADPDFILQCCIFEAIYKTGNALSPKYGVDVIPIPAWVFEEFEIPIEVRNFNYEAMLHENGKWHNHWVQGASVPDVTKLETQMFFYYKAVRYINAGFEAIHWGQWTGLVAKSDTDYTASFELFGRVREYANEHARRKMVLCDAHTRGAIKDGKLLFDSHAAPQRPMEDCSKKYNATLQVNYIDAIYRKSLGGITPSGWSCDALPYLVEFDNSGAHNPGVCGGPNKHWPWGWDEISWFAHCNDDYRNYWLEYATAWIAKTDPIGHLEAPGRVTIASDPLMSENYDKIWFYRINNKSESCPNGFEQEEILKKLWKE